MEFYRSAVNDVLGELGTSPDGLSSDEAQARLQRFGPNELAEKKRTTPLVKFLSQFKGRPDMIAYAQTSIANSDARSLTRSRIQTFR